MIKITQKNDFSGEHPSYVAVFNDVAKEPQKLEINDIISTNKQKTYDFVDLRFESGTQINGEIDHKINKKFFDFGNGNRQNNDSYNHILWEIKDDGVIISPNILKFTETAEITAWLTTNITNTGGNIDNIINIKAYVIISLPKFKNIFGINKGLEKLKGRSQYKDYKIRRLDSTWETFITHAWQRLHDIEHIIPIPPATAGDDCWLSSVAANQYVAFPVKMKKADKQMSFNSYEAYNRRVWNNTDNAFENVTNILNNYEDPIVFENIASLTYNIIDNSNYSLYGEHPEMQVQASTSLIRIYAFRSSYWHTIDAEYKEIWGLMIKPLGLDYFYTNYKNPTEYSLYAMLWGSGQAKKIIRKIDSPDILDNETEDYGWGVEKKKIIRTGYMINGSHLKKGFPLKNIKMCSFFYMNEATGEISEPYEAIEIETRKRGYDLGLKQGGKTPTL